MLTSNSLLGANVGVFGGGRMGAGIAYAFAVAGAKVTIIETSAETASAAEGRLKANFAKASALGIALQGAVIVETDVAKLDQAAIVVEAVPEHLSLKQLVLARIEDSAPAAAICSNTSSLSIDALAVVLRDPSRLIGLHFFNPVPASDLVEVVAGKRTAPELIERAQAWVLGLGKTAITVTDSPGFASSRLGVALALEAMRMLEEGVASATDIDIAMQLGYKHQAGPLKTTDIVGLDVRLAIAKHLEIELGPRFAPPRLLLDKIDAGELGRKTGRGFFNW